MRRYFHSFAIICTLAGTGEARQAEIEAKLVLTDLLGNSQELRLGLDATATTGIDAALGEAELPPFPPSGLFEARFIGTDIGATALGEGSYYDFRTGSSDFEGEVLHELRYQPAGGDTIWLAWDFPGGVSARLQDLLGGVSIDSVLQESGQLALPNANIITKLKLTVTYLANVELPPPPVLLQPGDGAVDVPGTATFVWRTAGDAISYHVEVASDVFFQSLVKSNLAAADTTASFSGLPFDTMLFWRVRGRNQFGAGTWSTISSFTTEEEKLPPPVPALLSPADSASELPVTPTFAWLPVPEASSFQLQVIKPAGFQPTVIDMDSLTVNSYTVTALDTGTTYFWRLRAKNANGSSPWSPTRAFTTISHQKAPGKPALMSPPDSATNVSMTPQLEWQVTPGATSYELLLILDNPFAPPVIDSTGVTGPSLPAGVLKANTRYYWKVRAANGAGTSGWSETFHFVTGIASSITDERASFTPQSLVLHQNYPNPFNPGTTISYTLAAPEHIRVRIFDVHGREIVVLSNGPQPAGTHRITWQPDATIASGIYIYRVDAGPESTQAQMIFIR